MMELVRAPRDWWHSHDNLADLASYLLDTDPAVDIVYMLRKPWKWQPEYQQMRREEELERIADEEEAWQAERRWAL